MLRWIKEKLNPNPLDQILERAKREEKKSLLIVWNRGLGDIALGLYALCFQIRKYLPDAKITFLTRENLKEGFILLGGVEMIIAPEMDRSTPFDLDHTLHTLGLCRTSFDLILEKPDPTRWLKWQLGKITPKLTWQKEWDHLWKKFPLEERSRLLAEPALFGKNNDFSANLKAAFEQQCVEHMGEKADFGDAKKQIFGEKMGFRKKSNIYIGAHVQTETDYATWRNWPISHWQELFSRLEKRAGVKILLFGFHPEPVFSHSCLVDLRGKTTLFELLSIIKNCCRSLVVLDSGISSMTYFLNVPFQLQLVSLWADPYMGILKQNVPSPNPLLNHIPIFGDKKNIANIQPAQVEQVLFSQ
ncbi:MAG: hypothetical protein L0207_01160 [Chlamydiae bacterium]|nr:hypothetical protein [Chlamydiota bacterium]